MTNTQNINTMKSTMIILATLLALVAAALVQGKAEAATGSIEDAKPAGTHMATTTVKAVKASSQPKTQTKSTLIGRTGYTGYVGLQPIQAYAYYAGNQYLTNAGANIYRSSGYSGDQIITMRTRIYKQDYSNGTYYAWQMWANPTYKMRVGPGQMAPINRQWFGSSDIAGNRYEVDVQIWWDTPGGTRLGYKHILLNHSSDFQCMGANCRTTGTEGNRVFLNLDYVYSGI